MVSKLAPKIRKADPKRKTYNELASAAYNLERMSDQLNAHILKAKYALEGRNGRKALQELKRAREEYAVFFNDNSTLDYLIKDVEGKLESLSNKVVTLPFIAPARERRTK